MDAPPLRVLVAEDDPAQRASLLRLLVARGAAVVAVADGPAAVDAAAGGVFDLLLLDCDLPGLDGLEVTRQLRAAGWTTLVCALTVAVELRAACAHAGMDRFVEKPLTPEVWDELAAWVAQGSGSPPTSAADADHNRS